MKAVFFEGTFFGPEEKGTCVYSYEAHGKEPNHGEKPFSVDILLKPSRPVEIQVRRTSE
jgi:hypothetical protein